MSFEHYLSSHERSPARTRLLALATGLATTGTLLGLVGTWFAGAMVVARVRPPTHDLMILQMTLEPPPPPAPPPAPPPNQADDTKQVEDEDEDPIEDLVESPTDAPTTIPDASKSSTSKPGIPGGREGGQIGGIPGGPGLFPGGPRTTITTLPSKSSEGTVQKKALDAVMAQATYSPDPDQKLLQATKAARFDKRSGKNVTSFCIDTKGKVVEVKTKTKFPGDPQVDKIIADTLKKWRFRPFEVGGKPVKTCTERTFEVTFR